MCQRKGGGSSMEGPRVIAVSFLVRRPHTHAGGDCISIHSHGAHAIGVLLRKALEHLPAARQHADGHVVGASSADACEVVAATTAERSKARLAEAAKCRSEARRGC